MRVRVAPALLLPTLALCLCPVSTTANEHAEAGGENWREVRLLTGEPQSLLQHMRDVEMDGPVEMSPYRRGAGAGGDRIVTGDEAEPHQFPHQVGMLIKAKGDSGMFFCGGSLLTPRWVLTAAHCGEPGEKFNVILGAHKIKEKEPYQQRFEVDAKDVVVHPGWDPQSTTNDIALVHLPKAAELNDYVKVVRIPSEDRAAATLWSKAATMSGWGRPSDSAQSISPELRFVTTRIVSNQYCDFRYFYHMIKDTNICASGIEGKSTCNGDSGGPLTINDDDGQVTLVGITSFGIALGCSRSWPPAFTRVTSYLPWIANVTGGGYQDTKALGPIKESTNLLSLPNLG